MVVNVELRRNPKNSIVCDGSITLLSRLIMNPRDTNWSIVVASCCRSVCLDWAMMSMLSRYGMHRIPNLLNRATVGFSSFVKVYGALLRPKGRQLNSHICWHHSNRRNFRYCSDIGTERYTSFRSNFTIQSFFLIRPFTTRIPSILK